MQKLAPTRIPVAALAVLPLLLSPVGAQVERYELGLRLRDFERALAATTDAARRAAALRELDAAVQAFFRLDTRTVALAVDRADLALRAAEPTPVERLARAAQVQFAARLCDPASETLGFTVSGAFPVTATLTPGQRDGFLLQVRLPDLGDDPIVELPLAVAAMSDRSANRTKDDEADAPPTLQLSATGNLPLQQVPPGDHEVAWTVSCGGKALGTRRQTLSVAADLTRRLAALPDDDGDAAPRSIERLSLRSLRRTLLGMTKPRPEETQLPGARLLQEAEAVAATIASGDPWYGTQRTGQFWLSVPVGNSTASVRLFVPAGIDAAKPRPLVVALHGAGGSENLFFDGYGDGEIVRQCQQRGFLLVAPRSAALGGGNTVGLIDALAARWPVDRERVLLVGHSMGAAQAVGTAVQSPRRFAAVAALGGGGSARKADGLDSLPFFVGIGSRDFARSGALSLHQNLVRLSVPAKLVEYPDVEHLAIVQLALPDVFLFFDDVLRKR